MGTRRKFNLVIIGTHLSTAFFLKKYKIKLNEDLLVNNNARLKVASVFVSMF